MPLSISSYLTPSSPAIPYLIEDKHVRGGYRTVLDYDARNAIPTAARRAGMLVCVYSTGEYFTLLEGNLTDWVPKIFVRDQVNLLDTDPLTVLRPGSFGIGGQAVLIQDSLDNYKTYSCRLRGTSLSGAPTADQIVVDVFAGDDYAIQVAHSNASSWLRRYNGVTWSNWNVNFDYANLFDIGSSLSSARSALQINNVDNTSDLDKPISTAVSSALNLKADLDAMQTALADKVSESELNNAIATSAYGIKYVWADAASRDAQTGMIQLEQGVQQDNRTVYSYDGSAWQVFYTLDGVHNHDADYLKLSGGTLTGPLITDHPIRTTLQGHSFHSGITDLVRLNLHGAGNEFLGAVLADDTGIGLVNKSGINTFRIEGDDAILAGDLDATSAHLDSLVMSGPISRTSANGTAYWMQQDGSGRQHWYWNTTGGLAPVYEQSNEGALDLLLHTDGGTSPCELKFRTASGNGKLAGDAIVWEDTLLLDNTGNFKYRGNDVYHSGNLPPSGTSGGFGQLVGLTSATTLNNTTDLGKVYACNSPANYTVTLPSAASLSGKGYAFFHNNAATGTVTISAIAGQLITSVWPATASQTYTLKPGHKFWIISDGANWYVVSISHPVSETSVASTVPIRDNTGKLYAADFVIGSDRRLKEDIQNLEDSLKTLLTWQGVGYVLKSSNEFTTGFIAQDIEATTPHLVKEQDGYKRLSMLQMLPFIVESIKTLHTRLEALEGKNVT